MSQVLVTATLEGTSGLTDDSATNTFVFDCPGETAYDAAPNLFSAVSNFWNDATGDSGIALGAYISPAISRGGLASIMRAYDLTGKLAGGPAGTPGGGPLGSPVRSSQFDIAEVFGASKALPAEVAIVCTLRANSWATQPVEAPDGVDAGTATDRPRQRHTGKLYIGPLTVNAQSEEAVTLRSRPTTNLVNTIRDACEALVGSLDPSFSWCVWSRKDAALREITHVQIDNAWDTMRSRGNAPTTRPTYAL